MRELQSDRIAAFANGLQVLQQALRKCTTVVRIEWTAIKRDRLLAELDPDILYDIGEVDCRSLRSRSAQTRKKYSSLVEMRTRSI